MSTIFQTSDLARQSKRVVEAASQGEAIIRDKNGTPLVMTQESTLRNLQEYHTWSIRLARLRALVASDSEANIRQWGELAWLHIFDKDDLRTFIDEAESQLLLSNAMGDYTAFDELIEEWKATASQLEDPLRRSLLLSQDFNEHDFVEAKRPEPQQEGEMN